MRETPGLKIRLSAHTDSRGTKTYNQNLSNRRALAAKNYLVQRGVNPGNITTEGFGENRLRNHCKDNVDCSETEHNFNRRTEVQIIDN
jgi:outer membrane protein OmpA-like peptidoglycan-associated protein